MLDADSSCKNEAQGTGSHIAPSLDCSGALGESEIREEPMTNIRKAKANKKKTKVSQRKAYAHIEVVVAFLVVNFFTFLVITRRHGLGFGRN